MILRIADDCELQIDETTAAVDGPTLAVLAGVHGDELEGIVAARLFRQTLPDILSHGRVRIVAVANPPAHAARSRCSPVDDANLARTFPGSPTGTITEKIADVLTREVIAGADLLVDLHSAGADYEMPLFAGCVVDSATGAKAREAAEAFAAPVLWLHRSASPGRSLTAANDLGVPAIYVEGSGGGGLRGADLDVYTAGLRNVLAWLGMAGNSESSPASPALTLDGGSGDVDASIVASTTGLCVTRVNVGQQVSAGQVVAEVLDGNGSAIETIRAPRPGTVMMLRRRADVRSGVGVVMLGPVPS